MKHFFSLAAFLMGIVPFARAAVVYVPLPPAPEWLHVIENEDITLSPKIDFNRDGVSDLMFASDFSGLQVSMPTNIRVGSRASVAVSVVEGMMIGQTIEAPDGITSPTWILGTVWPPNFYPPEWGILPSKRQLAIAGIAGVPPWTTFGEDGGYLAVELTLEDGVHYGWVRFENDGTWLVGGRITGYAWETEPGKGIIAGAIPEPVATGLLALAAASSWCRRRKGSRVL